MPALAWVALVALGAWSAARITEAVTDDPDVPNDPLLSRAKIPLYAGLAIAGAVTWWAIRK